MQKVRSLVTAVALAVVGASAADAQARFGAVFNWADETDVGVGARLEIPMQGVMSKTEPFSRAFFIGQFDFYFPDCAAGVDCTYFELNPSLAVPFRATNFEPYVGAGLHISRMAVSSGGTSVSENEMGLNLLGGLRFPLGGMTALTELRLGLGGNHEQFALSFGFMFGGSGSGTTRR